MSDPRHDGKDTENDDTSAPATLFGIGTYKPWPSVAHYYGDPARQFLVGAAALLLLTSPLYADSLRIEFPFEIIGALVVVAFAALTNPKSRTIALCDAITAGVGAAVYAGWAIFGYQDITSVAFTLRIVIALLFLFAFYFSMKTVRAFSFGQIGKHDTVDEFEDEVQRAEEDRLERENLPRGPGAL